MHACGARVARPQRTHLPGGKADSGRLHIHDACAKPQAGPFVQGHQRLAAAGILPGAQEAGRVRLHVRAPSARRQRWPGLPAALPCVECWSGAPRCSSCFMLCTNMRSGDVCHHHARANASREPIHPPVHDVYCVSKDHVSGCRVRVVEFVLLCSTATSEVFRSIRQPERQGLAVSSTLALRDTAGARKDERTSVLLRQRPGLPRPWDFYGCAAWGIRGGAQAAGKQRRQTSRRRQVNHHVTQGNGLMREPAATQLHLAAVGGRAGAGASASA